MTTDNNGVSRTRTRTMVVLGMMVLALLFILLAAGTIPRIENHRALVRAVADTQNEVPAVYVTRPSHSPEAGLTLAATTQAIQDTVIFARTSGYLKKRYVDIGDNVTEGQLLAL